MLSVQGKMLAYFSTFFYFRNVKVEYWCGRNSRTLVTNTIFTARLSVMENAVQLWIPTKNRNGPVNSFKESISWSVFPYFMHFHLQRRLYYETLALNMTKRSSWSWSYAISVVSSNPAHGGVYSIQHYVIKVCQWLAAGRWFITSCIRHHSSDWLLS